MTRYERQKFKIGAKVRLTKDGNYWSTFNHEGEKIENKNGKVILFTTRSFGLKKGTIGVIRREADFLKFPDIPVYEVYCPVGSQFISIDSLEVIE